MQTESKTFETGGSELKRIVFVGKEELLFFRIGVGFHLLLSQLEVSAKHSQFLFYLEDSISNSYCTISQKYVLSKERKRIDSLFFKTFRNVLFIENILGIIKVMDPFGGLLFSSGQILRTADFRA